MAVNQLWKHVRSGDTYVVTIDGSEVVAAAGPLTVEEIKELLSDLSQFDSDYELADAINEHQDAYRLDTFNYANY